MEAQRSLWTAPRVYHIIPTLPTSQLRLLPMINLHLRRLLLRRLVLPRLALPRLALPRLALPAPLKLLGRL